MQSAGGGRQRARLDDADLPALVHLVMVNFCVSDKGGVINGVMGIIAVGGAALL